MTPHLQVGLIGYGMAGEVFHAPLIAATPGLILHSVVERRTDRAALHYPAAKIVRHPEALFANPLIDLVVIATPNTSHFSLAQQALLAGKHVVVDKPFTVTSSEAQELIDLARRETRVLTVFHNRRWDGGFLTVRQILARELLGQLVSYEATFDRFRNYLKPNAWREEPLPGSGILYDLGAHLLDQALALFGWPEGVTAVLHHQRPQAQTDDAFTVRLDYPGLEVTLAAGMLRRQPRPHFALHGTLGSYVKFGLDPQEAALKAGDIPDTPGWGMEPSTQWGKLDTQWAGLHVQGEIETLPGNYAAFYKNVAGAILFDEELAVTAVQARDVIRLLETAVQSHQQRRTLSG